MSGPNWAPPWLLGGSEPVPDARQVISGADEDAGSYRNPFVDAGGPGGRRAAAPRRRSAVCASIRPSGPGTSATNRTSSPGHPHEGAAPDVGEPALPGHPRARRPPTTSPSGCTRRRSWRTTACASTACSSGPTWRSCTPIPSIANFGAEAMDPDAVPFAVALTAALSGRPVAHGGVRRLHGAAGRGDDDLGVAGARASVEPGDALGGGAGGICRRPAPPRRGRCLRRPAVVLRRLRRGDSGTGRPATRSSTSATSGWSGPTARSSRTPRSCAASALADPVISAPSERARIEVDAMSLLRGPDRRPAGSLRRLPGRPMTSDRRRVACQPTRLPTGRPALGHATCPERHRYEARLAGPAPSPPSSATSSPRRGSRCCTPRSRTASKARASGSAPRARVIDDLRARGLSASWRAARSWSPGWSAIPSSTTSCPIRSRHAAAPSEEPPSRPARPSGAPAAEHGRGGLRAAVCDPRPPARPGPDVLGQRDVGRSEGPPRARRCGSSTGQRRRPRPASRSPPRRRSAARCAPWPRRARATGAARPSAGPRPTSIGRSGRLASGHAGAPCRHRGVAPARPRQRMNSARPTTTTER